MRTSPEQIEEYVQTSETAMDLLHALEVIQLESVHRNEWAMPFRLKPHELAILRDTYQRLAKLRAWLRQQAEEELECQNSPAP